MTPRAAASVTVAAGLLPLLAAGCSVRPSTEVWRADDYSTRSGQLYRLAVLPFADRAAGHGPLWYASRPLVWLGRLLTLDFSASAPDSTATAELLRTLLVARLQGEQVSVVNPTMVDESLARLPAGFDRSDTVALARQLDVDGILTGELKAVGASYWLFSTHRQLAASVQVTCGWDGHRAFTADVRVDDTAGIDHGPTGFVSLLAVPLAALDSGPYTNMAIAWAEEVGQAMLGGSRQAREEPAPAFEVLAVDAPYRPLRPGDQIQVVVEGSAGVDATFDLGTLHREIPMFPVEADGAADTGAGGADRSTRYRGFYTVQPSDRLDRAPVIARLVRPSGGQTSRRSQRLIDILPPADSSADAAGGN